MKNDKEKVVEEQKKREVDVRNLNSVIRISKKLLKVTYFILILLLLVLITTICQKWHVLQFLGDLLTVISPLFIGFIIAWLFESVKGFLAFVMEFNFVD